MNDEKCINKCKLHLIPFGMALGITWGLATFLTAVMSMMYMWGKPFIDMMAAVYPGYAATWQGSFIGFGWGFLDGFICGFVIALIYNLCMCCCRCHKCK